MPLRDRLCPVCHWCRADGYEPRTSMTVLCPEGHETMVVHVQSRAAIHGDDKFIGGLTLENLDHHPVTVYSRSELNRELMARGLEPMVRHIGENGTDRSKHTVRWDSAPPYPLTEADNRERIANLKRVDPEFYGAPSAD